MKNVQHPENKDELRNLLVQEELVLSLAFHGLNYALNGEGFSSSLLTTDDVMNMICDVLADNGIEVTWRMY